MARRHKPGAPGDTDADLEPGTTDGHNGDPSGVYTSGALSAVPCGLMTTLTLLVARRISARQDPARLGGRPRLGSADSSPASSRGWATAQVAAPPLLDPGEHVVEGVVCRVDRRGQTSAGLLACRRRPATRHRLGWPMPCWPAHGFTSRRSRFRAVLLHPARIALPIRPYQSCLRRAGFPGIRFPARSGSAGTL